MPYVVNGTEQKVEMIYSRRQFTWATLMKLGGLSPDDERFTVAVKQKAAAVAKDDDLRKKWLQLLDLVSYRSGFDTKSGTLGPIADAIRPAKHQRDTLEAWRSEPVPVVYLRDSLPKKTVIPVIYVPGIFGSILNVKMGYVNYGPHVVDISALF